MEVPSPLPGMSRQPNDLRGREHLVNCVRFVHATSVLSVAIVLASCGGTTISDTTTVHRSGSKTTLTTPANTGPTEPRRPPKISGFLAQSASFITAAMAMSWETLRVVPVFVLLCDGRLIGA
jgi:hypothetical protein